MSKVFTYSKIIGRVYLEGTDEYEEYDEEFEYEVEDDELLDAVADIVLGVYFDGCDVSIKEGLKDFIKDNGNLAELVEDYEDELKDIFRQEAFEFYE